MALKIRTGTITPTQSTTLVKNIFRAAFSSVAYIRNFFTDDCFALSKIGTIRYHKLAASDKDEVCRYIDWLEKGVFDALQRKYLEVVLLEVFAVDAQKGKKKKKGTTKKELIECFSFKVSYDENGARLQQLSGGSANRQSETCRDQIKRNTAEVLHSLIDLTHSLRPLPPNRILSMKLLYTKDTPADYEPPLFAKASDDSLSWFEDKPIQARAGVVKTPYHQLSMRIRARPTAENMANNVLDEDQAKENRHPNVETPADRRRQEAVADEDAMVDVGGSQVNSARMRTGMVLRESQEACEEGATRHIPVRLQVRESGQKRKVAEAMDDETMASRESLPSKKRKVSVVKKTTEQLGR